ncbi:unnamed protein product [Clonostachys rhizophaga]|uniref:Lumazine-binding protein n=1 Tax=Clonostachys rhizophaga TaxID=160324 RepID=A0A9N9VN46_9HYPO|nr:unnamed protein product [Clonostachys rhizophaga]
MTSNAKPIPTAEYDAVIAAAQHYFDSLKKADRGLLEDAFHEDATMTGWFLNGTLSKGSYRDLYGYYKAYGPAVDIKARADVIGMTPTTAVVRAEMEGTPDNPYVDFLTLIKVDGKWKIISKVFHAYEKQ